MSNYGTAPDVLARSSSMISAKLVPSRIAEKPDGITSLRQHAVRCVSPVRWHARTHRDRADVGTARAGLLLNCQQRA